MQDTSVAGLKERLFLMVTQENLLSKTFFVLLLVACLIVFFVALQRHRNRKWSAVFFMLLCFSCGVWALFQLLFLLLGSAYLLTLSFIGFFFIPAFVCLHIWKQVYYKDISPGILIAFLVVPALLSLLSIFYILSPSLFSFFDNYIPEIFFYVYALLLVTKSYLLCLNVFYQMPRHMRKSTYYLLAGVSFLFLFLFTSLVNIDFFFDRIIGEVDTSIFVSLLGPIAIGIMLLMLYSALHVASSAAVIATSRDFVFSSLSTNILVLSNSHRILDWNKKKGNALPSPKYREKFEHYRERLLKASNGKVSSHGENIITLTNDNKETNYLITTHEIGMKKRKFGYLVEFSEVTKIYSILRYWEEIAMRDHLTSLYNRNAYIGVVQQIITEENMPLCVVVGDVNSLKMINDSHGHLVGDELLIAISKIIEHSQPEGSFAARIGGDEYILLLPGGYEEDALRFIHVVNQACSQIHDEQYGVPSISWGYAIMKNTQENYNHVFAKADQMMYEIKKQTFHFRSSGFIPEQKR